MWCVNVNEHWNKFKNYRIMIYSRRFPLVLLFATACWIAKSQVFYENYFALSPQCTKAVAVKVRCNYHSRVFRWISNPHAKYCFKCYSWQISSQQILVLSIFKFTQLILLLVLRSKPTKYCAKKRYFCSSSPILENIEINHKYSSFSLPAKLIFHNV
jgi:hypothetical protein